MDADVRLAEVGEDGEDEDGVWVEVKELDLVRLQDCKEVRGVERHQAGVEAVEEDGVVPLAKAAAEVGQPYVGGAVLVGPLSHQVLRFDEPICVDT